jgi:hypothetical protein
MRSRWSAGFCGRVTDVSLGWAQSSVAAAAERAAGTNARLEFLDGVQAGALFVVVHHVYLAIYAGCPTNTGPAVPTPLLMATSAHRPHRRHGVLSGPGAGDARLAARAPQLSALFVFGLPRTRGDLARVRGLDGRHLVAAEATARLSSPRAGCRGLGRPRLRLTGHRLAVADLYWLDLVVGRGHRRLPGLCGAGGHQPYSAGVRNGSHC